MSEKNCATKSALLWCKLKVIAYTFFVTSWLLNTVCFIQFGCCNPEIWWLLQEKSRNLRKEIKNLSKFTHASISVNSKKQENLVVARTISTYFFYWCKTKRMRLHCTLQNVPLSLILFYSYSTRNISTQFFKKYFQIIIFLL